MIIKIFGSGCAKCQALKESAERAVKETKTEGVKIQKVFNIEKMIEAGIMGSPALMIDEEIKAVGRVPDTEEIKEWLR